MIYLQKNKSRSLKAYAYAIITVLILVWFSYSVYLSNSLSGFLIEASRPLVFVKENVIGFFSTIKTAFLFKSDLLREIESLKSELEIRDLDTLEMNLVRIENEELKDALNRIEAKNTILARVLANPGVTFYDSMTIDQGENAGIKKDDKVLYYDVPIGLISDVYKNTAKVSLYSSYGNEFDVKIGGNSFSTKAVARGGGNFVAKVPKGTDINEGDIVKIPQIGNKVFATVEKIESKPADTFETVYFKSPINVFEIGWVEVKSL